MVWSPKLALALALAVAAPAGSEARELLEFAVDDAETARPTIHTIRLDVEGIDAAVLRGALELRVRVESMIDHHAGNPGLVPGQLYVQVLALEDGALALALVTADGRAFDRIVEARDDPPERVAAATIANLVFALEAGSLAPDRTGARAPEPEPVAGTADASLEVATEAAGHEPQPNTPAVDLSWSLGLGGGLGTLLGPGRPRGADIFAGWSGALQLALRSPRGALALLSLRGAGRLAESEGEDRPYGLARLRVGLGGGYVWRRDDLEAEVAGTLTVEPWWVHRGGSRETILRGDEIGRRWLFGGALRLAAGHLISVRALDVRVGPWLDLAGAFAIDSGVGAPIVRNLGGAPLFRLGAFELGGGLEARIWFDVGGRASARGPGGRRPQGSRI